MPLIQLYLREWSSALSLQCDITVEVKFNWGSEPSLRFQKQQADDNGVEC